MTSFGLIASLPARADQGLIPYVTAIPRELESNAVTFAIFQVERYDSNFLRLPDDVSPPDGHHRSGISSTSGAGLNFDKTYGLQRVTINTAITRSLYTPRGNLDETSGRFDSRLAWSITPQLTGNVIFDYLRLPTDYEYANSSQKSNPRTSHRAQLDVDFRPGAALHPRISYIQQEDRTQDSTFQVQSSRSNIGEASLIYDFASTNTIALFANRAKGRTLGIPDDVVLQQGSAFDETQYGVRVTWAAGGRGNVVAEIAHLIRDGQAFSARNFSGTVGSVDGSYAITGRTRLEANIARHLYANASPFSSYFEEVDIITGLAYELTGKLTLRPQYTYRRQRYTGSPFPNDNLLVEKTQYATLRLDWAVIRALDISTSISHSQRTATVQTLQFKDYNASVFARFKF